MAPDPHLSDLAAAILRDGPTRVLINGEAEGTTPRRAREVFGIEPDVIFIRRDGWSLGAPRQFEALAERIWRTDWIGVIRLPSKLVEPYRG